MLDKSARDKSLKDTYYKLLRSGEIDNRMTIKAMMRRIVESPAPSFFLAPDTIRNYIYMYENNVFLRQKLTALMQHDLYQLYLQLIVKYPDYPKLIIFEILAEQPAPRYYITPDYANTVIYSKN